MHDSNQYWFLSFKGSIMSPAFPLTSDLLVQVGTTAWSISSIICSVPSLISKLVIPSDLEFVGFERDSRQFYIEILSQYLLRVYNYIAKI